MTKLLTDAETDALCHNVATLISQGKKKGEIRAQLSLSHYELAKYLEHPKTQNLIRDASEETHRVALNKLKQGIERMADLTLKALEANLKKNSMQAVNTALQVMGAMEPENKAQGDAVINVIMPGGESAQPVIEVKNDME